MNRVNQESQIKLKEDLLTRASIHFPYIGRSYGTDHILTLIECINEENSDKLDDLFEILINSCKIFSWSKQNCSILVEKLSVVKMEMS